MESGLADDARREVQRASEWCCCCETLACGRRRAVGVGMRRHVVHSPAESVISERMVLNDCMGKKGTTRGSFNWQSSRAAPAVFGGSGRLSFRACSGRPNRDWRATGAREVSRLDTAVVPRLSPAGTGGTRVFVPTPCCTRPVLCSCGVAPYLLIGSLFTGSQHPQRDQRSVSDYRASDYRSSSYR